MIGVRVRGETTKASPLPPHVTMIAKAGCYGRRSTVRRQARVSGRTYGVHGSIGAAAHGMEGMAMASAGRRRLDHRHGHMEWNGRDRSTRSRRTARRHIPGPVGMTSGRGANGRNICLLVGCLAHAAPTPVPCGAPHTQRNATQIARPGTWKSWSYGDGGRRLSACSTRPGPSIPDQAFDRAFGTPVSLVISRYDEVVNPRATYRASQRTHA